MTSRVRHQIREPTPVISDVEADALSETTQILDETGEKERLLNMGFVDSETLEDLINNVVMKKLSRLNNKIADVRDTMSVATNSTQASVVNNDHVREVITSEVKLIRKSLAENVKQAVDDYIKNENSILTEDDLKDIFDEISELKRDYSTLREFSRQFKMGQELMNEELAKVQTLREENSRKMTAQLEELARKQAAMQEQHRLALLSLPTEENLSAELKQVSDAVANELKVDIYNRLQSRVEDIARNTASSRIEEFTTSILNGVFTSFKKRIVDLEKTVKTENTNVTAMVAHELSQLLPGYIDLGNITRNSVDEDVFDGNTTPRISLASAYTTVDLTTTLVNDLRVTLDTPAMINMRKTLTMLAVPRVSISDEESATEEEWKTVSISLPGSEFAKNISMQGSCRITLLWIFDGRNKGWVPTEMSGQVNMEY